MNVAHSGRAIVVIRASRPRSVVGRFVQGDIGISVSTAGDYCRPTRHAVHVCRKQRNHLDLPEPVLHVPAWMRLHIIRDGELGIERQEL
ncbi:hypothetical protein BGP85_01290 [Pseudomonas putida]|nr:hypothetical protein BGP85_01290 [Pseudomonas putida]